MLRQQFREAVERSEPHLRIIARRCVLATGYGQRSGLHPVVARDPDGQRLHGIAPLFSVHFLPEVLEQLGSVLVRSDCPQPVPTVPVRPPPAWVSPLPHRMCVVESDQPRTVRPMQCQRIAAAVRPLRRRLRPHHNKLRPQCPASSTDSVSPCRPRSVSSPGSR